MSAMTPDCKLHHSGHDSQRIICSGVPLKLNERTTSTLGRLGSKSPMYRPMHAGEPVWQHEVANHFRDYRRKRFSRPSRKRHSRIDETYRKRQCQTVARDILNIPTLVFPRLGTNHTWRGRQTLCQQAEPQHIESEHLRRIRTATSLRDFRQLSNGNPGDAIGQAYDTTAFVSPSQQTHGQFRQRQLTNSISDAIASGNYSNNAGGDSDTDDHRPYRASGVTYAACGQSKRHFQSPQAQPPTRHFERRRHRHQSPPSSSTHHTRREGLTKSAPHQRPLGRNNNRIEHYIDDVGEEHLYDDFAYSSDKDEDTIAAENLEWYIRLASRCYREGFKWHADFLRHRTAEAHHPLTRRPLRRIVEQYLENKAHAARRRSDTRGGDEHYENDDSDADDASEDDTTTRKNRISIDIRSGGSAKSPNPNHSTGTMSADRSECKYFDDDGRDVRRGTRNDRRNLSGHRINTLSRPQHHNHSSATPQQLADIFDHLCTVNNSSGRRGGVVSPPLPVVPQITLTDCCSSAAVDADTPRSTAAPTSAPPLLLTPSGPNQSSSSDSSTSVA